MLFWFALWLVALAGIGAIAGAGNRKLDIEVEHSGI